MNILKDPKFQELLGKAIAEEAREMDKIRREADEKRNKVNQRQKNMTKCLVINREVDIMMLQLTMILFGIAVIIKIIGESI